MALAVSDLITAISSLVDDSPDPGTVVYWINDAMANINNIVNAGFPYADVTNTTAILAIPEMWQRRIIVPFAAAKAKQQDSSQFEYTDMYNDAYNAINDFQAKYVVPVQYKLLDTNQSIIVNSASYTPVYGDTLQSLADANGITYTDILNANINTDSAPYIDPFFDMDIMYTGSGNQYNIKYIEIHPEADYISKPPYLYGGWG